MQHTKMVHHISERQWVPSDDKQMKHPSTNAYHATTTE